MTRLLALSVVCSLVFVACGGDEVTETDAGRVFLKRRYQRIAPQRATRPPRPRRRSGAIICRQRAQDSTSGTNDDSESGPVEADTSSEPDTDVPEGETTSCGAVLVPSGDGVYGAAG